MEHWIGLDAIHKLTKERTMKLKISMERFSGEKSTIYYDMFEIADEVIILRFYCICIMAVQKLCK